MSEKLLPCPWCGKEGVVVQTIGRNFKVECGNLGSGTVPEEHCLVGGPIRMTRSAAITAWNTRPTPPDLREAEAKVIQRLGLEHR